MTPRPWPLLCALLAAAPLGATAERPLKATLTEAAGAVEVRETPQSAWEPAEAGMTLAAGARLKTGADGSADLLFEDGTSVHVDKAASVDLEAAREGAKGRVYALKLWTGRLLSRVARRSDAVDYRVRTPVAVAAVRGTEFVADAAEDAADVAVFEGEVETQALGEGDAALGEPVALKPDQELTLERGRPAGPPRAISRAMADYRARNAALFRARIDVFRRDNARLRRLQQAFMERRRSRIDHKMRDFRKQMRRRQRQ